MLELWLLVALIILIAVDLEAAQPGPSVRSTATPPRCAPSSTRPSACARRRRACSPSTSASWPAGEDQARSIVEHAQAEAERQAERHRTELEASLQRRTEQALGRIAQEEARALQDVRNQAATLAIRTTERLLAEQIDGDARRRCWTTRSRRSAASSPDAVAGRR